jgi:glycosyltransferase involved in cell wall biosynthesis
LAHALPVICTPNTGSIVRDGVEGFIVPIQDSEAIVECLKQLTSDPGLYTSMSERALGRYRSAGNLDSYASRLGETIQNTFSV